MGDLSSVLKGIEKATGAVVKQVKDYGKDIAVEYTPSGSVTLDNVLGSGYPKGAVVEVFGKEASGKTVLGLLAIAEAQKNGTNAAFIDMEQALDLKWAEKLGVNTKDLIFTQPDYGEQALEIVEKLASSGEVGLIVVDSVASLVPKKELDGTPEENTKNMGLMARMLGSHLRKVGPIANHNKTTIIYINQIREKIGQMFGNPETTPGGKALSFWARLRIRVTRLHKSEVTAKGGITLGHTLKFAIVKNKINDRQGAEAELPILYSEGVNKTKEVVEAALLNGVINQNGAFFDFGDQKWRGREALDEAVSGDTKLRDKIESALRKLKEKKDNAK